MKDILYPVEVMLDQDSLFFQLVPYEGGRLRYRRSFFRKKNSRNCYTKPQSRKSLKVMIFSSLIAKTKRETILSFDSKTRQELKSRLQMIQRISCSAYF